MADPVSLPTADSASVQHVPSTLQGTVWPGAKALHVVSKLQGISYRKLLTWEKPHFYFKFPRASLMELTRWCLDSVTCALRSEGCTGHLPELCCYMIWAIQTESYLLSCPVGCPLSGCHEIHPLLPLFETFSVEEWWKVLGWRSITSWGTHVGLTLVLQPSLLPNPVALHHDYCDDHGKAFVAAILICQINLVEYIDGIFFIFISPSTFCRKLFIWKMFNRCLMAERMN